MTATSATEVFVNLLGTAALLLWGIRMVHTGMVRAFGADLRRALGHGMRHSTTALLTGLGVTAILQSSTATALMTASFASRGLVGGGAALAVMLGADVGTTLVAQVLAFDLGWVGPLLLFAGVVGFMASVRFRSRTFGRIAVGLGMVLVALRLFAVTSEPMRESSALAELLSVLGGEPVLAVLIAAALTWLAHSSLAIILLIVSLAAAGVVTLPLALALVVGANVGGAVVPLTALYSGGPVARRVPLGNLAFKLAGAAVALPLIDPGLSLLTRLDVDTARHVLNAHTAFNVALALVFLPLTGVMARVCARVFPDAPAGDDDSRPRYLDSNAIDVPAIALVSAARETLRMADHIETMLRQTLEVFKTDDAGMAADVVRMDDMVDMLHESIKLYLTKVSRESLDDEESRRCVDIIAFTTNLEHIGDIIDKNLLELAAKKIKMKLQFSDEGWREIQALHAQLTENLKLAMGVFLGGDVKTARHLLRQKIEFRDMEMAAAESHFARLRAGRIESIETSALHLDILRDLKRINSHLTSVAYPILELAGELRSSRLKPGDVKGGAAADE